MLHHSCSSLPKRSLSHGRSYNGSAAQPQLRGLTRPRPKCSTRRSKHLLCNISKVEVTSIDVTFCKEPTTSHKRLSWSEDTYMYKVDRSFLFSIWRRSTAFTTHCTVRLRVTRGFKSRQPITIISQKKKNMTHVDTALFTRKKSHSSIISDKPSFVYI